MSLRQVIAILVSSVALLHADLLYFGPGYGHRILDRKHGRIQNVVLTRSVVRVIRQYLKRSSIASGPIFRSHAGRY